MTVEIRFMRGEEIEAVAQLFHRVWHQTQAHLQDARKAKFRDFAFFENRVRQRAERTLVAQHAGTIVGFACWTAGDFHSLFVAPEFRSTGVGAKLLAKAEQQMRESGALQFELDCLVGNHGARRFYERHGWRVERTEEWEDETPDGPAMARAWMMVKP